LEVATMPNLSFSLLLIPALALAALAGSPPAAAPAQRVSPALEAASCTDAPAPRARREVEGCTEQPAPADLRSKLFHQLRYHSTFPATGPALLSGFRASGELTATELAWVADRLPRDELPSGAATLARLFPEAPATVIARLEQPARVTTLATR
jgi:hypothetical protein